jgi:hypothetical protein
VREEERVRSLAQAIETLHEYDKTYDTYCCRCQKIMKDTHNGDENNYILSCASCTKSVHEYGCATQEETVKGQYWQCNECRTLRHDIHPTYKAIETNKFENIHRKRIPQMTTMVHWKIKGHTEKHRVREFVRQTQTPNDCEDDTIPKEINNTEIRTHT